MNLTCWTTQQEPSYREGKRESFLSYYMNKDLGPLICHTAGEEMVLILQGEKKNISEDQRLAEVTQLVLAKWGRNSGLAPESWRFPVCHVFHLAISG